MKFKPTEEQVFPIEMACEGHNLLINAFAGTGKSTTFQFIADRLSHKRILYVTFGKENIVSAKAKFGKNVECFTAHALAYRFAAKSIPGFENGKVIPYLSVSGLLSSLNLEASTFEQRQKYVVRATLAIDIIGLFSKSIDRKISWKHLEQNEYEVDEKDKRRAMSMAVTYWDMFVQGNAQLTHDMYLKYWQLACPVLDYDLILFDEAQDADPLMIDVINRQSTQKIAVGDHHQQIYSFRGAVNALEVFDIETSAQLTQSFRYGPLIADMANMVLMNHKGINTGIKGNPQLRTSIERHYVPHDVMIGRTMKSLFEEMFKMMDGGYQDFALLGDVAAIRSIIFAINALKKGKLVYHPFIAGFDTYDEFLLYCKYAQTEAIPTYQAIMHEHGFFELIEMLMMLEGKTKAETILLTAHKSKGLEFGNVTLLNDFIGPEKKTYNIEESNLLYVALTRAMKTLNIGACTLLNGMRRAA